jgi:uncharacterized membrane protein YgdD (TMEM256/DUF423 family)
MSADHCSTDEGNEESRRSARRVLGIAGVLLASGTIIGALGAHALRAVLDTAQLHSLETAVHYQIANALGLLVMGVLLHLGEGRAMGIGKMAALLTAGVLCFSGGIYLMLAGAPRLLGFVTPVGGVLLIAGWTWFAWAMLRATAR